MFLCVDLNDQNRVGVRIHVTAGFVTVGFITAVRADVYLPDLLLFTPSLCPPSLRYYLTIRSETKRAPADSVVCLLRGSNECSLG